MTQATAGINSSRCGCGLALAALLGGLLWTAPTAASGSAAARFSAAGAACAEDAAVQPLVRIDLVACPAVGTPSAAVARFSVLPLDEVASVVAVVRGQMFRITRVGGLHGP